MSAYQWIIIHHSGCIFRTYLPTAKIGHLDFAKCEPKKDTFQNRFISFFLFEMNYNTINTFSNIDSKTF